MVEALPPALARFDVAGSTVWQLGGRRFDKLEADGSWSSMIEGGVIARRDDATAEVLLVCGECGQTAELERVDRQRLTDDDVVEQLRHGLEHVCRARLHEQLERPPLVVDEAHEIRRRGLYE